MQGRLGHLTGARLPRPPASSPPRCPGPGRCWVRRPWRLHWVTKEPPRWALTRNTPSPGSAAPRVSATGVKSRLRRDGALGAPGPQCLGPGCRGPSSCPVCPVLSVHPPGEGLGDGVLSPGCMWRGALPTPGRVTPPGAISEAGQLDAVLRCRRPLVVLSPAPQAVFRGLQPLTPVPTIVFPADKPEEIVPASKPSRAAESVAVESRVATIKQRPTSRCFPAVSVSDMNVSGGPGREAGGLPGPTPRSRAGRA